MNGINFTPEKLDLLAANADPKVFFSLMQQQQAQSAGGTLMGAPTPSSNYGSIIPPQGGAAPGPMLTPQMLQMLGPKQPQVLPPAGLSQNQPMGNMASFVAPPVQPNFSQILRRA